MGGATQTFGELIATARRDKGWSQEDLERESGVTRNTLSRWERGLADRPDPALVRAACHALNINPIRAAIALGYLAEDEADQPANPPLNPEVREILTMLDDTALTPDDRRKLLEHLRWLYQLTRRQAS